MRFKSVSLDHGIEFYSVEECKQKLAEATTSEARSEWASTLRQMEFRKSVHGDTYMRHDCGRWRRG
jgi:hypothetical protein